jgi:hypothetical protein
VSDPDKTPVRPNLTPIEQIALDVGEMRAEMRDVTVFTQRTLTHVLEHHEDIKGIKETQRAQDDRLSALERRRRVSEYAPWFVAVAAIASNFLR